MMKVDPKNSSVSANSAQLLQKLKRIKKQFRKEISEISDSVSLGPAKTKPETDDGRETESAKKKKRKTSDDNILRKRLDAKKARSREFDKKMAPLLNGEPADSGWIISGKPSLGVKKSGGSLLDIFGQVGRPSGNLKMGSQANTTIGSTGSFGSGNPLSDSIGSVDTGSYDNIGSAANQYAGDSSVQDSFDDIDAKFDRLDAESKARDEAARVQEQAQQQQEDIQRQLDEQTALGSSNSQAIADAPDNFEKPEEATFQPNSDTTAEVTAQELEAQVEEVVKETLGDGQEATAEMLEQAELKLEAVQLETAAARQTMQKEAPKFSQDLGLLMEKYAASDSRAEQEMIQGELEALLDGASDGLQTQVQKVRGQLNGMFEQSRAIWASREAAQDLQVVSASKLAQERKDTKGGTSDAEFLRNTAKKNVFHDAKAAKVQGLSQKPAVQQALKDKGVAG